MAEHEIDSTVDNGQPGTNGRGVQRDPGFPGRGRRGGWRGPLVDYKDIETLRKFMTTSSKLMSRKRGGTSAQEQKALKIAVKRARFLALIPYAGA